MHRCVDPLNRQHQVSQSCFIIDYGNNVSTTDNRCAYEYACSSLHKEGGVFGEYTQGKLFVWNRTV